MTKRLPQIAGAAALALVSAASAFADIKLNDNFSVGGYVVGSANYVETKPKTGNKVSTSKLDGDAYKFWTNVSFAPVTGTLSFYAGSDGAPVVLDAYATYDIGGGSKVSFGKFLSWLGYEAFDPINMTQITYAWQTPQGAGVANIPAYHSGVKFETGNDSFSTGIAVVDSIDGTAGPAPGYSKGDGDLKNGAGVEAFFTYKGVKNLTIFLGGYLENNTGIDDKKTSLDLWAQYVMGDATFAAEVSTRKDDYTTPTDTTSNFWLLEGQYAFNKAWSLTGRVSGINAKIQNVSTKPSSTTVTVAPTLTLTANLSVVFEYSYTTYKNYGTWDTGSFIAAQGRFKF
jgi:hypothetical protein